MLVRNITLAILLALPSLAQYDLNAKIQPAGLGPGDQFGSALAATHDLAVFGAPRDSQAGVHAGAVYVRSEPDGLPVAKLTALNASPGDLLGGSVAVANGLIAAGMHVTSVNVRSVYVFSSAGVQLHELQAPVPSADDGFGESVAISGQFVLVGAPDDDEIAPMSGAVYVFDIQTGALLFKRKAPSPQAGDQFGAGVALDGNIAVVGMPAIFGASAGAAFVIDLTVDQLLRTIPSPCACGGGFATRVAVFMPYLAVNSPGDGRILAFHINQTAAIEITPPAPPIGFGYGLDLHDTRLVAGHQDTFAVGSAYVYDVTDGRMIDRVTPEDLVTGDIYGVEVAANVWGVILGAPGHDQGGSNAGAAYSWRYSGCPQDRYCSPAVLNSSGFSGLIDAETCALGASLLLRATNLPPHQFGYLLVGRGTDPVVPPGSQGSLCLTGSSTAIGRYIGDVASSGAGGLIVTDLVNGVTGAGVGMLPSPPGGVLIPGESWNFQLWYRDGQSSNFTDAISVLFE